MWTFVCAVHIIAHAPSTSLWTHSFPKTLSIFQSVPGNILSCTQDQQHIMPPEHVDTTQIAIGNNFTTSVPTTITCFPFCYNTSTKFHSPLHPYKQFIILQSTSGKLILAGSVCGERKKQKVEAGYAVGTYFLALHVSDKFSPTYTGC